MSRMAGEKLLRRDSIFGNPGAYLDDTESVPSTQGVTYPQDQMPAGMFGGDVDPTELPMMRHMHMQSPRGGITLLPDGEQGPAQGANTPIKRYGDQFMPDGRQPSGYVNGPTAQLAPPRVDGYVDHPAVQDTGLPYIVTPEIERLRRNSMNQFQQSPHALDMLFKGV